VDAPRYIVVTVSGYFTDGTGRFSRKPGLSATVVDTLYNHREIATFRSEDRWMRFDPKTGRIAGSGNRGVDGARASAQSLADQLNREDA
jgi:hypothetical protein